MLIIASGRVMFSITLCHSPSMEAMKTLGSTVCLKSNRHLLKPYCHELKAHMHLHTGCTSISARQARAILTPENIIYAKTIPETIIYTKNPIRIWVHLGAPWIRKIKNPSVIKPGSSPGWTDVHNRPWFLLHSFLCRDVSECFLCCVLVCSPWFWRSQTKTTLKLFPLPPKGP